MIVQEEDFLDLIYKNQALIHKVCNVYRDTIEDKEDLFQEIIYQLWRSFPQFKGKSKISTWMYRIALNTAISSFRKPTINYSGTTKLPDIPSEVSYEDERLDKLFSAIKKLDDAEKAIISLYLDDMDITEIANIVGITKNNVSVRLNRIKTKIKTLI